MQRQKEFFDTRSEPFDSEGNFLDKDSEDEVIFYDCQDGELEEKNIKPQTPSYFEIYNDGFRLFNQTWRLSNYSKNFDSYIKPFTYSTFFAMLPFLLPEAEARTRREPEKFHFADPTGSMHYSLSVYRTRDFRAIEDVLTQTLPCDLTLTSDLSPSKDIRDFFHFERSIRIFAENKLGNYEFEKCIVDFLRTFINENKEEWDKLNSEDGRQAIKSAFLILGSLFAFFGVIGGGLIFLLNRHDRAIQNAAPEQNATPTVTPPSQPREPEPNQLAEKLNQHGDPMIPHDFQDPVSFEVLDKPYVMPDGATVNYRTIQTLYESNRRNCLLDATKKFTPSNCYPNLFAKNLVDEWADKCMKKFNKRKEEIKELKSDQNTDDKKTSSMLRRSN